MKFKDKSYTFLMHRLAVSFMEDLIVGKILKQRIYTIYDIYKPLLLLLLEQV